MPKVELIYDRDCPNVGPAREQLLRALTQIRLAARWREWRRDDPDAPLYVRNYGSPTVLVDGCDVQPCEAHAACCRIYAQPEGGQGPVPAIATIVSRLRGPTGKHFGWHAAGVWGPAVTIAFLPKLVCPACWPAYAAMVSSLGLSFLLQSDYLFALTLLALALVLGLLAWRAPARQGYGPLLLGLASSIVLVIGKFFYQNNIAAYMGAGLLLAACLWNSWPRQTGNHAVPCAGCSQPQPRPEQAGGHHDNPDATS